MWLIAKSYFYLFAELALLRQPLWKLSAPTQPELCWRVDQNLQILLRNFSNLLIPRQNYTLHPPTIKGGQATALRASFWTRKLVKEKLDMFKICPCKQRVKENVANDCKTSYPVPLFVRIFAKLSWRASVGHSELWKTGMTPPLDLPYDWMKPSLWPLGAAMYGKNTRVL